MRCSICQFEIDKQFHGWAEGHNAAPVNSGRCCTRCNDEIVIPARLAGMVAPRATPKDALEQLLLSSATDLFVVLNCLNAVKPDHNCTEQVETLSARLRDLHREIFELEPNTEAVS